MRAAFDYEEARDRAISDIANRLFDTGLATMDKPDEDDLKWLWIECETDAIKQVEAIEKRREEMSVEDRAMRWLWNRGIVA